MQADLSRRLSPTTLTLGALASCALGTLSALPLFPLPTSAQSSCRGALPACVPMGDRALFTFCRPPLPPGQRWAGDSGSPVGFEEDLVCDNFLGACAASGDSATILICNHAGQLFAYPGVIELNGSGETGKPKIFVRWTSVYTAQVTNSGTVGGGLGVQREGVNVGGSLAAGSSTTATAVRYAWHDSSIVEVRPC